MTIRRSLAAQTLLFAVSLAFSLVFAARLPATVVIHWGLNGQPDGWGSKWTTLLLMPGIQILMAGLTVVLPRVAPREPRLGKALAWAMIFAALMMTAIHVAIVMKTAGAAFDLGRVLFAVIFAAWIPLGAVLKDAPRNPYMGIRTPWTLASDRVWQETHRTVAKLWVVGGAIGLVATLFGAPIPLLIAYLLAICLLPVVQSYWISKR